MKLKLKMTTPTLVSCLRSPNGDGPRESAMWTAWVEISDVNSEISPSGLNSVFWRDLNCNIYSLASKLQDLLSVTQKQKRHYNQSKYRHAYHHYSRLGSWSLARNTHTFTSSNGQTTGVKTDNLHIDFNVKSCIVWQDNVLKTGTHTACTLIGQSSTLFWFIISLAVDNTRLTRGITRARPHESAYQC